MRILHFIYGLKVGGAETFIASILGRLNHDEYEFGFVLQDGDITNRFIADYIKKHNCEVFVVPRFPAGMVGQYKALLKILREHRYDYVHIHMNAAVNPVPLVVARRGCGDTKFILHSHSSDSALFLGRLLHSVNSRLLVNRSIIKLACSDVAGKWMFRDMAFQIVDNAVDVGRFTYNGTNRLAIRDELKIDRNAAVIGSVGRFVMPKNHRFMVEWFSDYSKTHTNAVLLLVGDGPLLPDIKRLAAEKNVADRVVFTGIRTDTPAVLSAIDCFIMPSHFEGLGFTAIEAQASGLHVVASTEVPSMINIDGLCRFLSLKAPYADWSEAVDHAVAESKRQNRVQSPVAGSRFDIDVMISQIKDVYS